jgi:hypothetical protein
VIRVIGPKDKKPEGCINTTSSSMLHWSKLLSPFYLGPVNLYGDHVAKNMENAWQYSKVYFCHADLNYNPTLAYWDWAKKGWNSEWAQRYPMGKNKKPLYSLWEGEKLGYIEARKQIYIPLYKQAVENTDSFKYLQQLYRFEKELTLFDYDGYDYLALGMTLEDVLNNPNRKMGHAFVLAMLLSY